MPINILCLFVKSRINKYDREREKIFQVIDLRKTFAKQRHDFYRSMDHFTQDIYNKYRNYNRKAFLAEQWEGLTGRHLHKNDKPQAHIYNFSSPWTGQHWHKNDKPNLILDASFDAGDADEITLPDLLYVLQTLLLIAVRNKRKIVKKN